MVQMNTDNKYTAFPAVREDAGGTIHVLLQVPTAEGVTYKIHNRKLQVFGHICRMPDDRLLTVMAEWKVKDDTDVLRGDGL